MPKAQTGPRHFTIGAALRLAKYCDNSMTTSKYTLWNFPFKNLFEQFHRVANVYFLVIATLQLTTGLSPTNKYSTASPLALMMLVSAVKEAVEDVARHREDSKVNQIKVTRVRGTTEAEIHWEQVCVGDVLKLRDGEKFPADLLLLDSASPDGKCYVETAELDGETNLKIRKADGEVLRQGKAGGGEGFSASAFDGVAIECDAPNAQLYVFNGKMELNSAEGQLTVPLSNDSVLLRGAKLKNVAHVHGLVVYTGKDTKLAMNQTAGHMKSTRVDSVVNKCIVVIFLTLMALCVVNTILSSSWAADNRLAPYLPFLVKEDNPFVPFITYLILFNPLVPISLYVTLEVVKLFMASLVDKDTCMYYAERDMPAKARTSNLHEDLGQIEYIFSDKTGTLTRNEMEFKKASFAGVAWRTDPPGEEPARETFLDAAALAGGGVMQDAARAQGNEFFRALALCHTVVIESRGGEDAYQAESPDEEALVMGAKNVGLGFVSNLTEVREGGSTQDLYGLSVRGESERWEKHEVNAFTSARKRMSLVVRSASGQYVLYAKGADMMMQQYCQVKIPAASMRHTTAFAIEGLRTLVVARKELSDQEYADFRAELLVAQSDLTNREQLVAECAARLERNMDFVGVTAIEDKLQEGVPACIAALRVAGLKIWVLTGDKEETAINIGKSCRLLDTTMDVHVVRGSSTTDPTPYPLAKIAELIEETAGKLDQTAQQGRRLALVIDGKALGEVLRKYNPGRDAGTFGSASQFKAAQSHAKERLVTLGDRCAAVIGCRVSPKQKRDIVRMVQKQLDPMTLSIGDGANDVSMIQEAHIGVGISGNEGMQAVRSADYAIGQFRYLERLLLVHGRWNYRRICKVILYTFYKNLVMVLTLLYYGFANGVSGTTLYESWLGSGYNAGWTMMPIIAIGFCDKDVNEHVALARPELYKVGQLNSDLKLKVILGWTLTAFYHATVVYWLPMIIFAGGGKQDVITSSDGTSDGLYVVGTAVNFCLVLTVTLKVALMMRTYNLLHYLFILGSLVIWFSFVVFDDFVFAPAFRGVAVHLFSTPAFWLAALIVPFIALLPDFLYTFMQFNYYPQPWDTQRALDVKGLFVAPSKARPHEPAPGVADGGEEEAPAMSEEEFARRSLHPEQYSSFAFSHAHEGAAEWHDHDHEEDEVEAAAQKRSRAKTGRLKSYARNVKYRGSFSSRSLRTVSASISRGMGDGSGQYNSLPTVEDEDEHTDEHKEGGFPLKRLSSLNSPLTGSV